MAGMAAGAVLAGSLIEDGNSHSILWTDMMDRQPGTWES